MALKRWGWLAGAVLAALLVAIALLPPRLPNRTGMLLGVVAVSGPELRAYYRGNDQFGSEYSQFREDLLAARLTQRERLRRAVLSDSILMVARGPHALTSADGLITLVYERPLTADSARFWLGALGRELALYPKRTVPGTRLVIALLSDSLRAQPGVREATYLGNHEFLDQASSAGPCLVTVSLLPRLSWGRNAVGHDSAGRPVSRLLGTCAVYARFGAPGAGVRRWVASASNYYWGGPLTWLLQEARRHVETYEIPYSWNNTPWNGEVRWLEIGCLRGGAAPCRREAGLNRGQDGWLPYYISVSSVRSRLVAYLLATGTPEQFASFWHSPRPVAEALARAYGTPAGELAMSAYRHWFAAPPSAQPMGSARNAATGLVWVSLALALAVIAGRRWKTEL
jgi:hypothetical protein